VFTICCVIGHAASAEEKASGVALGVRAAYGVPMGPATSANGDDLQKSISGGIPLWFDLGYRVSPRLYIGAFFIYEFGFLGSEISACQSGGGVSCDIHDIVFGGNLQLHIRPGKRFDPWIGGGAGYELLSFSASANGRGASASISGFQLLDLQVGGDLRFSSSFVLGPFLSLSFGQYDSMSRTDVQGNKADMCITNTAVHEWLLIGVRGQYAL
jgi:hypothetical protein